MTPELYISAENVNVYALDASGNAAPLRTITGVNGPIALDGKGNLYVNGENGINIYGPDANGDGSTIPHGTIVGAQGASLAVDNFANVYALNAAPIADAGAAVAIYSPDLKGNYQLFQTVNGLWNPGDGNVAGIAVDYLNQLYVLENEPGIIRVYAPPFPNTLTNPVATINVPTDFPNAMDFDFSNNAYVGGDTDILVFEPVPGGGFNRVTTIEGPSTGLVHGFVSVAVDPSSFVYAESGSSVDDLLPQNARVTVYSPGAIGNSGPAREITGIDNNRVTNYIAINKPRPKQFVVNPGSVLSIVGTLVGPVAIDGGGWIVVNGVPHPVGPGPGPVSPAMAARQTILIGVALEQFASGASGVAGAIGVREAALNMLATGVERLRASIATQGDSIVSRGAGD